MEITRLKYGFVGEKYINVPEDILENHLKSTSFGSSLYATRMGYFPNAQFHYHTRENGCNDYVLIYCIEGRGYCQTLEDEFSINANQFILLPPNQFHRYWADLENPWTIYWVHIGGKLMNELIGDLNFSRLQRPTDLSFSDQIAETWHEMYSSLCHGYAEENIGYANFCLHRFFSLFLFPNRITKPAVNDKKEDQLEQSIVFMKANIHKRLTAEEIAQEFHYSSSHYSVLFKQKTGLSPIDYFIRIKIRYACQLLAHTNLLIKEIANKVGYDDPYYFTRLFKKVTGRSPIEYKEIHQEKNKSKKIKNYSLIA